MKLVVIDGVVYKISNKEYKPLLRWRKILEGDWTKDTECYDYIQSRLLFWNCIGEIDFDFKL